MAAEPNHNVRAPRGERPQRRQLEDWAGGYSPMSGIPDEFMDSSGAVRPHWRKFMAGLSRIEPDEMAQRFAGADRRIREMGISYRVHGEANERTWPLERLPLVISDEDWRLSMNVALDSCFPPASSNARGSPKPSCATFTAPPIL